MAEGRGKAQADSLRKSRKDVQAKQLAQPRRGAVVTPVFAPQLRKGDFVMVEAGDYIPVDGEIVEGVASVDESAITGESAPVIRESGGDRSAVTGGTRSTSRSSPPPSRLRIRRSTRSTSCTWRLLTARS
jgi:potassium-transporting ATPase ATP-binding subunit